MAALKPMGKIIQGNTARSFEKLFNDFVQSKEVKVFVDVKYQRKDTANNGQYYSALVLYHPEKAGKN